MALDLNVTRKVLEQTDRRSWRLIWEKEIQPLLKSQLPTAGQPAEGEQPEETPNPTRTRRPKETKGAKQRAEEAQENEWSTDNRQWERDFDRVANEAMRVAAFIERSTAGAFRRLVQTIEPSSGARARQVGEAWLKLADCLDEPSDQEAGTLIQKGRVKVTPARRASPPVQQPSP
jgi:hypothetical protein